jgi:hypothetical protein
LLREFISAALASLKDSRLWLITIPLVVIFGLALAFSARLAAVISIAVCLVAAHLINRIEFFPRPNEKALATTVYRSILLPSAIGIFLFTNTDLLARVFFMLWHWTHASSDIPACTTVVTEAAVGWLGVPLTATLTAVLTKERAVFATIVGLMVDVPLKLTFQLTGDHATEFSSMLAKSCKLDVDPASDPGFSDGAGLGVVTGAVLHILIAIFVARLVSALITRKDLAKGDSSVS